MIKLNLRDVVWMEKVLMRVVGETVPAISGLNLRYLQPRLICKVHPLSVLASP